MAYYDYTPSTQSPHSKGYKSTCKDELTLKTGDFIVVHGEPEPNGFYFAEVSIEVYLSAIEIMIHHAPALYSLEVNIVVVQGYKLQIFQRLLLHDVIL